MFLIIHFVTVALYSQEIVSWRQLNPESETVQIEANIQPGWHLYSQKVDAAAGPVPTQFLYMDAAGAVAFLPFAEPEPIAHYDSNFEAEVLYFENQVIFEASKDLFSVDFVKPQLKVVFMVCNDHMCLPPEEVHIPLSTDTGL